MSSRHSPIVGGTTIFLGFGIRDSFDSGSTNQSMKIQYLWVIWILGNSYLQLHIYSYDFFLVTANNYHATWKLFAVTLSHAVMLIAGHAQLSIVGRSV